MRNRPKSKVDVAMKVFKKVYVVSFNANEYKLIEDSGDELIIFDGSAKQDAWQLLNADWLDHESYNKLPVPDVAGYGATVFALPESLIDLFSEKSIKRSSELLPIKVSDGQCVHLKCDCSL